MHANDTTPPPLRYDPSFEFPAPDEADTLARIEASMRRIQETTLADGGRPLRSVHAKSHGLLVGELVVEPGLPPELAQGVCARPGRWPVVLRLSTIPGDLLPDAVSTPRGVAIKVIGVEGERLPGSESDVTQDFVLVEGPAFPSADARPFAKNLERLAATTDRAPGAKQALATVLRGVEKLVEAVGGQSATLRALGGHPATHPLVDTYFSQVPVLWGPWFGKLSLRPRSPALAALAQSPIDLHDRPDALRDETSAFFAAHDAEWELAVQLATDLEHMPIEDAARPWDETLSPYVPVARLVVPRQPAWSPARAAAIDEALAFSPWHGLAAHRPLGSVMRLRKAAYAHAQRFRAEHGGRTLAEPRTIGDVRT